MIGLFVVVRFVVVMKLMIVFIVDEWFDIKKGFVGVVVDIIVIFKVVLQINLLIYWGYLVQDLVVCCSFEQVVFLLWCGELFIDVELVLFSQCE